MNLKSKARESVVVALTVAALIAASGCSTNAVAKVTNNVETEIQNALGAVTANASDWSAIASGLATELKNDASDLVAQVQTSVTAIEAAAEDATICTVDFFGHRFKEFLQRLLHSIDKNKPEPEETPVVCETNPSEFITAGATAIVAFHGYDFAALSQLSAYQADVEYANGEVVIGQGIGIAISSNQVLTANIQGLALTGLDRTKNPQLVLKWNNGPIADDGGSSAIPIVVPPTPAQPIHTSTTWTWIGKLKPGGGCIEVPGPNYVVPVSTAERTTIDQSQGSNGVSLKEDDSNALVRGGKDKGGHVWPGTENIVTLTTATQTILKGTFCAATIFDAGAVFQQTYTIYLTVTPNS